MKKIILFTVSILLLINLLSAGVQFLQTKTDLGNKTVQNRILFCYDKQMSAVLPDIKDFITGNNFYNAYILYSVYIQKWNTENPNYIIDYCNISFQKSTRITNFTELSFIHLTSGDYDTSNIKYFFELSDGDCAVTELRCRYNINAQQSSLDIPAEMQFVSPTFECKSCQDYENALLMNSVSKTNTINSNTIRISRYIKDFVLLNFGTLASIWWIFLIYMLFVALGLIFIVFYWSYEYLNHLSK